MCANSPQSKKIFSELSGKSMKMGSGVLLSILLVCCARQTAKTEPSTPIAFISPSPAVTLDPKVALRESMIQVLGTDHEGAPRLTKISYSDPEAGDITITWAINDDGSQYSRKTGAQIDAVNILKVLEKNKTRFIYVILVGTFSTQDGYGGTTETQVMSLGFNKSKLDRINWEEFQPSDVYDLADIADLADEWK
ncbi:MAG: hypothetical protein JNM55_16445 [Anaerolineales bacterium]|nr:hypothetical protein [Anaerolineales bacterium]